MRAWWRDAVFYQIYPRSFADSDGDGIGDLRGIIDHMDFLRGAEHSLGVDALWISPFYPSPMADFGYDISNYCDVDPVFGTLADFDELIREAHGRGLRVLLDFVPNHTSDRHSWFRSSRSSTADPRRDWYVWRSGRGDSPPNNWMAEFRGIGSAWTFDAPTNEWYLHSFLPSQPDLNWDNPEVERAMHGVMEFWLNRGADGFRVDVVHKIGKAPDLRDNAGVFVGPGRADRGNRFDEDWPSVHPRIRRMRTLARRHGACILVGEVYVLDAEQMAAYVRTGRELDLAHNFEFLTLPWKAAAFRDAIREAPGLLGPRGWPTWCLNNHDHSRVASRYPGEQAARVAAMMLLTLRGTPFLYQGEELGLEDGVVSGEEQTDVEGRDPERCPIPWVSPDAQHAWAGFSSVRPWLPIPPDASVHNVADEWRNPQSVLTLYRALLRARHETPALRSGSLELIDADSPDLLAYRRSFRDSERLVALNFGLEPASLAGVLGAERSARIVLSSRMDGVGGLVGADTAIPPLTGWLMTPSGLEGALPTPGRASA